MNLKKKIIIKKWIVTLLFITTRVKLPSHTISICRYILSWAHWIFVLVCFTLIMMILKFIIFYNVPFPSITLIKTVDCKLYFLLWAKEQFNQSACHSLNQPSNQLSHPQAFPPSNLSPCHPVHQATNQPFGIQIKKNITMSSC